MLLAQTTFAENKKVGFVAIYEEGVAVNNCIPKSDEHVLMIGLRKNLSYNEDVLALQRAVTPVAKDGYYMGLAKNYERLDPKISQAMRFVVPKDPAKIRTLLSNLVQINLISEDEKQQAVGELRLHSATEAFRANPRYDTFMAAGI